MLFKRKPKETKTIFRWQLRYDNGIIHYHTVDKDLTPEEFKKIILESEDIRDGWLPVQDGMLKIDNVNLFTKNYITTKV